MWFSSLQELAAHVPLDGFTIPQKILELSVELKFDNLKLKRNFDISRADQALGHDFDVNRISKRQFGADLELLMGPDGSIGLPRASLFLIMLSLSNQYFFFLS